MKKNFWLVAFGVAVGLMGAGLILLISNRPRGQPVTLLAPPTPPPMWIHVAGAVSNPGLVSLPTGSRVQDAIQAAGGLLPEANAGSLNLAALLQDGDRIVVPARLPTAAPQESDPGSTSAATPPAKSLDVQPEVKRININTATLAELDTLPGIGPVTAQSIIAYREAHGPFNSIEEIMDVPGIGPVTFERIKDLITVLDE